MNRSKKIHRGGSQLLALMLVLAIAALVAPAGMEQYSQYMARKSWKVSADQFNTVQDAALSYMNMVACGDDSELPGILWF